MCLLITFWNYNIFYFWRGDFKKWLDFLCELVETQPWWNLRSMPHLCASIILIGLWKLKPTGDKDGQENLWYQIKHFKQKRCASHRAWIVFMPICSFMRETQPSMDIKPSYPSSIQVFSSAVIILRWGLQIKVFCYFHEFNILININFKFHSLKTMYWEKGQMKPVMQWWH